MVQMAARQHPLISYLALPCPPTFLYLHHPHHPSSQAFPPISVLDPECMVIRANPVEYFNLRLFLSGLLYKLAVALGQSDESVEVADWDAFRRKVDSVVQTAETTAKGKGKGKALVANGENNEKELEPKRLIILVDKAERLKTVLGPHWHVMSRLNEFIHSCQISVVLASQIPWDEVRPPSGSADEPMHVFLSPVSRDETLRLLVSGSQHPLYPRFLELLMATMFTLLPAAEPIELEAIAQTLWPIYTLALPTHAEQHLLPRRQPAPDAPPLGINVMLLNNLKHSSAYALAAAIETLLPQRIGHHEFLQAFLTASSSEPSLPKTAPAELGLYAKYLLVAGYLASYNPAASDLKMFGRGTEATGGKKRRGGGNRRVGYGKARLGKVSQRLLGPKAFPLERLLAIFAALYAEHGQRPEDLQPDLAVVSGDEDESEAWLKSAAELEARAARRRARKAELDEDWEDEVDHIAMSSRLWGLIPELESQRLLQRISPTDRLDNVQLRCEIGNELARTFARELKVPLDDYLWEAMG